MKIARGEFTGGQGGGAYNRQKVRCGQCETLRCNLYQCSEKSWLGAMLASRSRASMNGSRTHNKR